MLHKKKDKTDGIRPPQNRERCSEKSIERIRRNVARRPASLLL